MNITIFWTSVATLVPAAVDSLKLKEIAMDVRGYLTGPINAKGAFTSEIDLPPTIKPGPLNTVAEADRPHLVDQPGMRHKYLPLRHDPATGAISSGGRYLFRGYEDATKYRHFLEANRTVLKKNGRFQKVVCSPGKTFASRKSRYLIASS